MIHERIGFCQIGRATGLVQAVYNWHSTALSTGELRSMYRIITALHVSAWDSTRSSSTVLECMANYEVLSSVHAE